MGSNARHVLVVDDDKGSRIVLDHMLRSLGVIPLLASSAALALDFIHEYGDGICLVLVDLAMPEVNGFELSNVILNELELYHLPIIAITARDTVDVKSLADTIGIRQIVPKPFVVEELQDALNPYLTAPSCASKVN